MNILHWVCVGLNLGLLPALVVTPIEKPEVNMQAYESHLFMEMLGNLSKEEESEQETSEEVESSEREESRTEVPVSEAYSEVHDPEPETVEETCPAYVPEPVAPSTPLYTVGGQMMPEELQTYLYQRLAENRIEWFMPYAVLIAKQESDFNIYAENPNGRDKGLYQYRIEYVPWMDWTNPYQQIDYFVAQMANRAYAGKTVSEMISAHNMSDWGAYNQEYVNQVMQWANVLQKVR